jgi:hypothetical protein
MAILSFTIKNADTVNRIQDAFKKLYPIPQIPDPRWIDPKDGSQAPLINMYTDAQWVRSKIIKYVMDNVRRFETSEARKEINITGIDDMMS